MPDELASQMPILKDVLAAMNIPMYELDGWEADDLIGTISVKDTAAGWETVIVTGDKDSLQLVTDATTVKLVSTRMGRTTTRDMTPESFREEYGFDPIHIIDLKALMGDSSDNIPGVKGVGEKTAMALVQRYGSIDALYAAMPGVEMAPGEPAKPGVVKKLSEGEEMARMSYDLATIHTDAPIDFTPEDNLRREVDGPRLYQLFLDLEFAKLIDKYRLSAPQGEGQVREERAVQGSCTSEVVETRERLEELLALWKEQDEVDVLSLPSLDVVCVEWWESETDSRAALLFSDRLEGYNDGLKALFGPEIQKAVHGSKELCRRLLDEGISPGGIAFDTEVAAYLLAPTDGSYELEKLGMTYYNQEFPKAKTYLEEGPSALWPTRRPQPPPSCPTPPSSAPCGTPCPSVWRSWAWTSCTRRWSFLCVWCWPRWSRRASASTGGRWSPLGRPSPGASTAPRGPSTSWRGRSSTSTPPSSWARCSSRTWACPR